MNKKILLFIFCSMFFLCCTSCTTYSEYQKRQLAIVSNSYVFPYFNKIVVSKNARVEIISNSAQPYLYCKGSKKDVDNIAAYVKEGSLYISSDSSNPYIKLNVSNLNSIYVLDNSYVKADYLTSKDLSVKLDRVGSITLRGMIGLKKIEQLGGGKVDIGWINSDSLLVTSSGAGPIYLSGIVKSLQVQLQREAYFEARYLRAEIAAIIVTDNAKAHVLATEMLNVYAEKAGNIYYHKRPKKLNKVSLDSGNILLLDEIS